MRTFLVMFVTPLLLIVQKTNAEVIGSNFFVALHKTASTVVMVISVISLLLTIRAYLMVEKLKDLHGNCFMCYVTCLFMGYLFMVFDLWDMSEDFWLAAGFIVAFILWLAVLGRELYFIYNSNPIYAHFARKVYHFLGNKYALGIAFTFTEYLANKDWIYAPYRSAIMYDCVLILLIALITITIIIIKTEVDRQMKQLNHSPFREQLAFLIRLCILSISIIVFLTVIIMFGVILYILI